MVPILLTYLVVGLRGSPAEVDWRTKGATTPVRNQGQMGSAIDFSLLEAMATYSAVHTGGTPPMLSSGMLADCAYVCPRVKHTLPISASQILSVVYHHLFSSTFPSGLLQTLRSTRRFCKGASPVPSASSLWECVDQNYGGLCLEADYPSSSQRCPRAGQCTNAFSTKGLGLVPLKNETEMTDAAARGVLVAAVDASSPGFETYALRHSLCHCLPALPSLLLHHSPVPP